MKDVLISIDTTKADVAKVALDAGANIINDTSGGMADPNIIEVVRDRGAPIVLMHMRGNPKTMSSLANYPKENGTVLQQVANELSQRIQHALSKGVLPWNIFVDPGIGFAKQLEHNIHLLSHMSSWKTQVGKYPVVVGTSRKRFIGQLTSKEDPKQRVWGTAAAVTCCVAAGVQFVRVHDVEEINDVLRVANEIYTCN